MEQMDNLEITIFGTYEKQIYFNPETGQTAFLLKPADGTCTEHMDEKGLIKATGKFCLQKRFLPLSLSGEWQHSEYGEEFLIQEVELFSDSDEKTEQFCIEQFSSVPRRQIKKALSVTGADVFTAADTPDIENAICEKTGADEFAIVDLFTEIRKLKNELELFKILTKYNGSYEQCMKILKAFPDNTLEILEKTPFRLVEEAGVPFKLIDRIALDNGIDAACEARVQAILLWCIRRETNAGNVYMDFRSLCKAAGKQFGDIPDSAIASALKNHPRIIQDKKHPEIYYEKKILADENNAAINFARLMKTKKSLPWHPEYIERIEKEEGWKFGSQQKEAFYLLQSTGIKVLTGDPGTGKTTTLKGLLKYLVILWNELYGKNPQVALCAPSGRAAQRMKESTKRHAQTIHKLIEYQPYKDGEYFRDANNPIDADIVIVDETSMMGLSLFAKLSSAIRSGSFVLFVGDINQLPSVDCGDVLHDIISCGYVDICHLTEEFRQEAESLINVNAKRIIYGAGSQPLLQGPDFELISCTPGETAGRLDSIITDLLAVNDPNSIQVLAPTKKGSCGVRNANVSLQKIFNPDKGGIWYGYRNFKEKDRVIMEKNNYKLNYFNGDIGYILKTGDVGITVEIGDETVIVPKENYCDMELAYAITIHKSQGSEYPYLVIVIQEESAGMLDVNILYTAVTRGMKKVIILYENNCLQKAMQTVKKGNRKTLLKERIRTQMQ